MAKKSNKKQARNNIPGRVRYDSNHRVRSARLDPETNRLLDEHLNTTGSSFADFVKDSLGREHSAVEKRIEILASKQQLTPALEERLKLIEGLTRQVLITAICQDGQIYCPRCENQQLRSCDSNEMFSPLKSSAVITWKCPKCGFFVNTYNRIDPQSLK